MGGTDLTEIAVILSQEGKNHTDLKTATEHTFIGFYYCLSFLGGFLCGVGDRANSLQRIIYWTLCVSLQI